MIELFKKPGQLSATVSQQGGGSLSPEMRQEIQDRLQRSSEELSDEELAMFVVNNLGTLKDSIMNAGGSVRDLADAINAHYSIPLREATLLARESMLQRV